MRLYIDVNMEKVLYCFFIKNYMSKICHNCVDILSSKHTYRLMRACIVFQLFYIIIHQTHYEKSDWSRAFNQFTIACELDMINAISDADIAFIMSSSMSAWLLSLLECSPQKQNV